jgi:hypothetical protein
VAQRFIDEATAQVAPLYQQQEQALQSQIPAIQQLYQTLYQGLEGQRASETQNILESASSRGVLRSTMPVDLQTQLGTALLAERSKLGSQQAQEIAGVNMKIGDLGLQKTSAINQIADTLYNRDLTERKFQMEQQMAAQQAAAAAASARSGGGGGGGRATTAAEQKAMVSQGIAGQFQKLVGRDGFVGNNTWAAGLADWVASGGTPRQFWQQFGQYVNPKYKPNYSGYNQR